MDCQLTQCTNFLLLLLPYRQTTKIIDKQQKNAASTMWMLLLVISLPMSIPVDYNWK
jgi:hypothetical protein